MVYKALPPGTMMPIPDILATWPWKRSVNPLMGEVVPESEEWARSFNIFDSETQKTFEKGRFGLLGSMYLDEASRGEFYETFFLFGLPSLIAALCFRVSAVRKAMLIVQCLTSA